MEVGEKDKEEKTVNSGHGSGSTALLGDLLDAHKSLGYRIIS